MVDHWQEMQYRLLNISLLENVMGARLSAGGPSYGSAWQVCLRSQQAQGTLESAKQVIELIFSVSAAHLLHLCHRD
jgi:hypothetical protein